MSAHATYINRERWGAKSRMSREWKRLVQRLDASWPPQRLTCLSDLPLSYPFSILFPYVIDNRSIGQVGGTFPRIQFREHSRKKGETPIYEECGAGRRSLPRIMDAAYKYPIYLSRSAKGRDYGRPQYRSYWCARSRMNSRRETGLQGYFLVISDIYRGERGYTCIYNLRRNGNCGFSFCKRSPIKRL